MPKTKVVGVRVPMDDYYSFMEQAAANKVPIGTWAHKVLSHEVMQNRKMKNGGKIDTVQIPGLKEKNIEPILYRIVYETEEGHHPHNRIVRKMTEYYSDNYGGYYDVNKNKISGIDILGTITNNTATTYLIVKNRLKVENNILYYFSHQGWYKCKLLNEG